MTIQKNTVLAMWNQVYLIALGAIWDEGFIAEGVGSLLCHEQASTVSLGRMGWVLIASP